MCSVTWKSAVRLVFCGSRDVGSACRPSFKIPPRLGWPAWAAAVGWPAWAAAVGWPAWAAAVGWAAAAAVGLAAAAVVGCAAAAVVGFAAATAVGAAAGAVVGLAAGGVVGAAAGTVGAAGAVAGPHADSSSIPAASKLGDGRTRSICNDPLMEAPDYNISLVNGRRPVGPPAMNKFFW